MNKLVKYILVDLLRSKVIVIYTVFLLVLSFSIFNMEDNAAKGIISLLNVVLFMVPLVSIIFSTIYIYNSAEFIELLVSQPLKRQRIWLSLFWGLTIAICLAFLIGVGIPMAIYAPGITGLVFVGCGMVLSVVFVSIACWAAVRIRDKAKGIGLVIVLWLYFSLLFDALVLLFLFQFSDYPIEKTMIAITALNPIDLGRILILLHMDISAMMGYTGAIFREFFGTLPGMTLTVAALALWCICPIWLSQRYFKRKDL